MDVAQVLLDILVVLVAAKIAAEGAERLGVPAVVGEIIAGVLIGPSVLGLVGAEAAAWRGVATELLAVIDADLSRRPTSPLLTQTSTPAGSCWS